MYNKKAVSDVVSTVLIILLVVAAVAIVGAIILRVVGNAGPQVDTAVQCQALEITANSCSATTPQTGTAVRGAGGSESILESITYQFQSPAGVAKTSVSQATGSDLTIKFSPITSAPTTGVVAGDKMVVYGKIVGASNVCPASLPVTCTA
ncbi:MAG: hypothetical protein AABX85_03545 [Nanoarchaeota archaeon]